MEEISRMVKCSIVILVTLPFVQIAWKKIVNIVIEISAPTKIY